MGLYSKHIFSRMVEWALGNEEHAAYRRELLAGIEGEVLELGFGTGLNLPHYPTTVSRLVAIDQERMLPKRVEQRRLQAPVDVKLLQLDASGRLPFDSGTFDNVVSTWTLCSIRELGAALAEVRRVLKKTNGSFRFLEHGRSDDPSTAKWQDRLNPIQKIIAGGCHLNRQIDALIQDAGFEVVTCDRFLMPQTPRMFGEMYKGVARVIA